MCIASEKRNILIKFSEEDDILLRYYVFVFDLSFKCCLNYFMLIHLIIHYHSLRLRRRRRPTYILLFILRLVSGKHKLNRIAFPLTYV